MNQFLEKILNVQSLEFIEIDRNFNILDYSPGINRFAEHLGQVQVGQDSRIYFPELIGLEDVLPTLFEANQEQLELTAICRETPNGEPLYFNLYAIAKTDDSVKNNHLLIFFQDVTQQSVLERKYVQITNDLTLVNRNLSVYKNYLQYIIKYMADSLFVTNALGIIEECNHAAQNLLEISEDNLLYRPIHQVFQDVKLLPSKDKLPEELLTIQILKNLEVNYLKPSGVHLTVLFNCSLIKIDNEEKFVYIGRDITERKRVEKEMEIALQKERELNELKSNFLSMTSHEFRTPLTVILSAAELLQVHSQNASDPKSSKYIDQIHQSVENLLDLLDNLLVLGKADSNKLVLQRKLINLTAFCEDLLEKLELNSPIRRISLVNKCADTLFWPMDEKLLDHILNNLLSNALKYSPNETPIYLRLYRENNTVSFEVEDQGIGIYLEDQQRLFELFHRGKNVGNIPGNGLGMAIVKKSVEIYGGSIMVSSQEGAGTLIKVDLPLT
jgi:PAS domain S-box-containing protein